MLPKIEKITCDNLLNVRISSQVGLNMWKF